MKDAENLKKAVESLGGEFELVRELGRGATAVVYLLRDHALDRDLAMKVIRATLGGDEEALARLQREARLVAQLMHPNIVKLYGTHRLPDGSLALLMEHVPGRNLKEVLRAEGALSVPNTVKILKDVASALAYAHRRRIVHRDVKPENIYIDEEVGAARLADFGVARPWDQDARLTIPGASLGTPAYMSPEQIDGKEVDGRTDVYSLGLVGYELLLGHHPWEGENVFTIIFKQKNEELPIDLLDLVDAPALARTLERSLQKDPAGRPESAQEFLEELSEETASDAVRTSPSSRRIEAAPDSSDMVVEGSEVQFSETAFDPVDWDSIDPGGEESDRATGRALDDSELVEVVPPQAPLGIRPRRKWAPVLTVAALVAAAGSYSIYKGYLPWDRSADPGELAPVSASPAVTNDEPATSPETPDPVISNTSGIVLAEGAPSAAPVGSVIQLQALVRGEGGLPLGDTLVLLQVEEGEGTLETAEARTDLYGMLEVAVALPEAPGATLIHALVAGAEDIEARFEILAQTGRPEEVRLLIGDRQAGLPGETLPEFLGVRVLDEAGNPIPEIEVRFEVLQGDGQVAPEVIVTDDVGRAFTRWTLGTSEGPQWVTAVVPDVEEALFTFQATARATPLSESPTAVEEDTIPDPEPEPETPRSEAEAEPNPEEVAPAPEPVVVIPRTFAIGGSHVCHISGGTPICRGANDRGQAGNRSLEGLVAIEAGIFHGCGLDAEGRAWCWGANESGQLGDGSTLDSRPGSAVDTDTRFSVLAAGLSHTCALGPGGTASCWGRNIDGQLGDGSRDDHSRPEPVGGGQTFRSIVAGWYHTCGLVSGNRAYCWGSNSEGQLGDGFRVDRLLPTRVSGSFQVLAAGANHTCGIRGEEVFCWGDNAFGQLGDGTTEDRLSPSRVSQLPGPAIVLATGAAHTCAVLADRSAYCWGQNLHGQLGDGTTVNRSTPVQVSGGMNFLTLSAGGGVTCGFARGGAEYCWGLNQSGQLGDGSRTNRSSPVLVGGNDS